MVNATPANLSSAIAQAKAENKLLLLEFGSSDSCPPCMLFEQEVFSKPEFMEYGKTNLVFVRIDFPAKSKLPSDVETTNVLLGAQFEASAFPTFVALDKDGKEFWRMPAKDDPNPGIPKLLFSPQGFIGLIETLKAQRK
jgi:thioredoxin-related protein